MRDKMYFSGVSKLVSNIMKTHLFYIFIILLCSCDTRKDCTLKSKKTQKNNIAYQVADSNQFEKNPSLDKKAFFKDSFPTFEVDDYPITIEMLRKLNRTDGVLKYKSGKTVTYDNAWFTDSHQTIVIQLATDYYRFITFHFLNKDIPEELIFDIGFNTEKGDFATNKQVKIDFPGFLSESDNIDSKYFHSDKGIELGINQQKAISIYGNPDSTSTLKGVQKLVWSFYGDEEYLNESTDKPRAKNSFGHKITMYFRKDKLIAQKIFNDIP